MLRKTSTACLITVLALAGTTGCAEAKPGERVRIQNFSLDATEVTIGQFREFASAVGLVTAAEKAGGGYEWDAGWQLRPGWTVYRPYGREPSSPNEPAVHVTWEEATEYCRWRGGRLPTLNEWRQAAFTEQRANPEDGFERGRTYPYPVGETPDGMNTNRPDAWPVHAPAGTTRRGVNGLYDMGGNVWEWLADRRDDQALTAGGSWWYGPPQTMAEAPQWKPASFSAVYIGFRCAYD